MIVGGDANGDSRDHRELVQVAPPGLVAVESPPAADRHPVAVYLARLAPGSRRSIAGALAVIAETLAPGVGPDRLPWWVLRYSHCQAVRAALADRYAPATANRALAALRGVLRECWRLGLMPADQMHRATDLASVRGSRVTRGRALTADELGKLFAACGGQADRDARDAALLALLYGCGLRRSEAVALDVRDLAGGAVRVRGKGNKERLVPLAPALEPHLERWLAARGRVSGALFLAMDPGHRGERLTDHGVLVILRRVARTAGVAVFSPHDCRRTFVSSLLAAGADLSAVQRLAGHAAPATTVRYDKRGDDALRAAVALLRVPR